LIELNALTTTPRHHRTPRPDYCSKFAGPENGGPIKNENWREKNRTGKGRTKSHGWKRLDNDGPTAVADFLNLDN